MAWPRYGMHLGTAFQLIDDVLDYSGDEAETGKHLGDDLAEGKPTLPLIHVMQTWQRRSRRPVCARPSRRAGATTFPEVLAAVKASGALDAARRHAEAEAERCDRCN